MVIAAAGPGSMPPNRTWRPSGRVTSRVPRRNRDANPKASRVSRGRSGKVWVMLSGVRTIGSGIPQIHQFGMALGPGLAFTFIIPRTAERAVPDPFPAGSRGTNLAPLLQRRKASQWIAAMILNVTRGRDTNDRNRARVVSGCRRPLKVAESRGPSPSVSRIRSLTDADGGDTRKWYRVAISTKGET